MVIKINPENPDKKVIEKAAEMIENGGLVIFPTDTVYGILADARNKKAVGKIFEIKKRPKTKPLAIFVKNIEMAEKYAFISEKQKDFLRNNWPGKLTVILKSKNELVEGVETKDKTIGLRMPDYKLTEMLFEKIVFPLVQTSANISGKEATTKIKEVLKQFDGEKTEFLVVDAGDLAENKPSKIIDLTKENPLTIRF
jgi:L-threonylcarbamoyladenylate synthase